MLEKIKNSTLFQIYKKYEEVINYLITGGLTTVFNVVFYFILTKVFHADYMISTIVDWIVTVLFAYLLNKIFVFHSKKKGKLLYKEIYEFFKYRVVTLIVEIFFMYIFVDVIHVHDIISKIVVNIIVIILNYIFSKLFIFKKEEKE